MGFGSKYVQLMRLGGGLAGSDWTEKEMYQFWREPFYRDNPIAKFFRSQVPPTMESVINFHTNENYLGEPLNDMGAVSIEAARNAIPFSVETLVFDRGPNESYFSAGALIGATAEIFGGRQFPISIYEQLRMAQDEAAMKSYDKPWDELDGLQKDTIEKDPAFRVASLKAQANEISKGYQRALGEEGDLEIALDSFFTLQKQIDARYAATITEATRTFEIGGAFDSEKYKRVVDMAASRRNSAKRELRSSPEFQLALDTLRESAEKNDGLVPAQDLGYVDFIERVVTNPLLTDKLGNYDFKLRRELERQFVEDWGEDVLAYVNARFRKNIETETFEYPDPLKEIAYGNEKYRSYWDGPREQMRNMPQFSADIAERLEEYHEMSDVQQKIAAEGDRELRIAIRTEQEIRNIMRENDRDLDIFIVRWHGASTLRHPDNQWAGADVHYASGDVRRGLWAGPPYPQTINVQRPTN